MRTIKLCSVKSCIRKHAAKSYCLMHYKRISRHNDLDWGKKRMRSHGLCKTPEYRAWHAMKQRCTNPKATGYAEWYGGQGITVCNRWLDSFESFLEDMGKRPSKNHSLDRINCKLDYSPDNCRWADKTTQANNTSRNVIITFRGETLTLSQWSRELEIGVGTLKYWVNKRRPL